LEGGVRVGVVEDVECGGVTNVELEGGVGGGVKDGDAGGVVAVTVWPDGVGV
jgi:hypothetical protein